MGRGCTGHVSQHRGPAAMASDSVVTCRRCRTDRRSRLLIVASIRVSRCGACDDHLTIPTGGRPSGGSRQAIRKIALRCCYFLIGLGDIRLIGLSHRLS
jgi:hypothetical protein